MISLPNIRRGSTRAAEHHPTVDLLRKRVRDEVLPRARSFWPFPLLRTFRLGLLVDLEPLFEEELEDKTEGFVPNCSSCDEHCCEGEGSDVRLRLLDLAYLKDAGLLRESFVEKNRHDDDEEATLLLSERLFPKLRRKTDGTCVFFDDGKCGIYPIRPLRCRRFPYRLHDDKRKISFATRCRSRRSGTQQEQSELREAVVENYNEKLRDLVTLAHRRRDARDVLKGLELELWVSVLSLKKRTP